MKIIRTLALSMIVLNDMYVPVLAKNVYSESAYLSTPPASDVKLRLALTSQFQALQTRLVNSISILQDIKQCHEPSPTTPPSPKQFYGRLTSTSPPGCFDPLTLLSSAPTTSVLTGVPSSSFSLTGPAFVPNEYIRSSRWWDVGMNNMYNHLILTEGQEAANEYALNHYRDYGVDGIQPDYLLRKGIWTQTDVNRFYAGGFSWQKGPGIVGEGKSFPGNTNGTRPWTEEAYKRYNPDVEQFLLDNPEKTALDHYRDIGINEGRSWGR